MAKKSNKTAHVLNLLTNNRDANEAIETQAAPEVPAHSAPPAAEPAPSPKPKPTLQLFNEKEDQLSEQIRLQLEQLLLEETQDATAGQPMLAQKDRCTIYDEAEHNQNQPAATAPAVYNIPQEKPEPAPEPDYPNNAPADPAQSEPEMSTPESPESPPAEIADAAPEPTPEPPESPAPPPPRPELPVSQNPDDLLSQVKKLIEDKQSGIALSSAAASGPDLMLKKNDESGVTMSENISSSASNDYVTINVVEDIVKSKAHDYALKLGGCGCYRCVSDIIALTLNSLKPQYIVTHKGMLFAKISSYENQYAADIAAALTKACMMVREAPRH